VRQLRQTDRNNYLPLLIGHLSFVNLKNYRVSTICVSEWIEHAPCFERVLLSHPLTQVLTSS
jgi:hypothetical protein